MRKILSIVLSFGLLFQYSGLLYAAGEFNLANYLSQARSAIVQPDQFRPAQLRYISYDIKSNDFKLLLDKGDRVNQRTEESRNQRTEELWSPQIPKLNGATQELFNYFLIGLSLPNDTFWVNLRPDAPDNIIDPLLEKTDIGKIFLEADLQLKKDTASLTSPQNPEGKLYWDKLYKKAGELFGTENITIPTITRPWIVPNEVIVRETEDSAYIYKATLKVMLEEDYLTSRGGSRTAPTPDQYAFSDPRLKELNEYSTQLIRETIIPKLTKEINSSKRYAQLRQVYYSLVLSRWFKQKYGGFKSTRAQGTSASVNNYLSLIDSGNLTSNLQPLTSQQPYSKEYYFQAYQKSFKDGEYNLKETVATPFGQSIRSYISGGIFVDYNPAGIKVNSSPVTNILTEQPPATTASPITAKDFENAIIILSNSKESPMNKIEQLIRSGVKLRPEVRKESLDKDAQEAIGKILDSVFRMNIIDIGGPSLFSDGRSMKIDKFLYIIKSGLKAKNESLKNNLRYQKKEIALSFMKSMASINKLLSLFYGQNERQKSLTDVIEEVHKSVVETDKIRFDGSRDHDPKEVGIGVERILKKILEADREAISYESLELAQELFVITSQEDKTYRYRKLIGAYIKPVFAGFLKKNSKEFNVEDIQIKIKTAFSGYIRKNVIGFLKTFILNNKKFIGQEKVLGGLSVYLEEKTREAVLEQTRYDMGYDMGELTLISLFIKKLRGLSKEDTQLITVEEGLSLIKSVTAGSPLSAEEFIRAVKVIESAAAYDKAISYEDAFHKIIELVPLIKEGERIPSEWITDTLFYIIHNGTIRSIYDKSFLEMAIGRRKYTRDSFLNMVVRQLQKSKSYQEERIKDDMMSAISGLAVMLGKDLSKYEKDIEYIRNGKDYSDYLKKFNKIRSEVLNAIENHFGRKEFDASLVSAEERLHIIIKYNSFLSATDKAMGIIAAGSPVNQAQVVSSSLKKQFGGIDLTDRMLNIKLERVGSFASSALVLPEINNVEALDLDKEYERIQAMASSSIRPSDTRILEFAAACYYRGEFDRRLTQVSSCVKSAHLADERLGKDSSDTLRLATMLPDALYGG